MTLHQAPHGAARRTAIPLLLTLLLAACGGGPQGEEAHDHGQGASPAEGVTVTVTPAQFTAIDGVIGQVEMKDIGASLKATGFLKVPPQNVADVTATMGGTVREVLVQEGDHVRKGQPLAIIADAAIIALQREHLDAKARLAYAKAELDRQTELAGANVSAQRTLQQAVADHATLLAAVRATAEQLRLVHIDPDQLSADGLRAAAPVTSPIDGTVAEIAVNTGSKVSGDAKLFRVVNNDKLHVDLFLYEQDIGKVKVGQRVDLGLTNLPGHSYSAVVFAIGGAFANETKAIPVHAEITGDKEGLINGMGVTARVNTGEATVPAVLTDAIVNLEGRDFVFIREGGGPGHAHAEAGAGHAAGTAGDMSFRRVEVKRGATDGGFTAVTFLQPVEAGAEVATGGAYYLLSMLNTSEGHEH